MSPGKIRPNTANSSSNNNRNEGGFNGTPGGIIASFDSQNNSNNNNNNTMGGTFGNGNNVGYVSNANKPASENIGSYLGDTAKAARGEATVMGTYVFHVFVYACMCVCVFVCVCVCAYVYVCA